MIIVTSLLFLIVVTDLVCYLIWTPHPGAPPRRSVATPQLGTVTYGIAYIIGIARLPYALLPYIGKLILCSLLQKRFSFCWQSYPSQALRLIGDVVQLGVGYLWIEIIPPDFPSIMLFILRFMWGAEAVRLLTEKGGSLVSAIWQWIPHRAIAHRLWLKVRERRSFLGRSIRCYLAYYRRTDCERLRYLQRCLRQSVINTPTLMVPLTYFKGFQIVPENHALRGGNVRDVAHGLVFIHNRWTNDPWLLIGLALRRSPWIFDPRYLSRPFAYRSQANRLMTLVVLQHAFLSPPFAWYQWGHQIKAARFELFYRFGAKLNLWHEPPIFADGTAPYDPLMTWLYFRGNANIALQTQWSDEAVLFDIMVHSKHHLSDVEIAKHYGYPLNYVQEVLGPLVRQEISTLNGTGVSIRRPSSPSISKSYTLKT